MVAVALSLAASWCWGVADFTGGLKTKRMPVPLVLLFVEGVGLVWVLAAIAASGEALPSGRAVAASLVAGAAGVVALGSFYRALAIGTMSVVAPISATGVILPVAVGVATGDALSILVSAGLVITIVGILLASREQHDSADAAAAGRLSLVLALLAALGFGSYFVLSDVAADESILWLLALARVVVVPVLAAVVLAARAPRPVAGDAMPLVLAGTLDVAATGLYAVAATKGAISIVSVVGSLYPITTVLLARVVLHERLRPVQAAGVAAAFTGVALIVAG
jgi:drug/metabolite transporter (DMT)-like permease